jgi:quercetin dioxygenase-like cupin family protein
MTKGIIDSGSVAKSARVTWHVDELPWTELKGLAIQKAAFKTIIDSQFTDGAYNMELTTIAPGGSSPTHHEPYSHVFYVLAGSGEVQVGDETASLRPGSVSPIRAGQPHSLRNTGGEDLVMLVIYNPPRTR